MAKAKAKKGKKGKQAKLSKGKKARKAKKSKAKRGGKKKKAAARKKSAPKSVSYSEPSPAMASDTSPDVTTFGSDLTSQDQPLMDSGSGETSYSEYGTSDESSSSSSM